MDAPHHAIGADHITAFNVTDDQVVAKRIEFIDIQTGFIGTQQPLVEFQVEYLETQALRFDYIAWSVAIFTSKSAIRRGS